MSTNKHIKKGILALVILTFVCCKSSNFLIKKGDQSIALVIPNNELVISNDTSTTFATLKLTNIDKSKVTITGVGVSIAKRSPDNNLYLKILTRKTYYKGQSTYDLNVSYRVNGELFRHTFEIPIRLK